MDEVFIAYFVGFLIWCILFGTGVLMLISPTIAAKVFRRYPPGMSTWISATPGWVIRPLGAFFAFWSTFVYFAPLLHK